MKDSLSEGVAAELAKIHGVNRGRVASWAKEGMPLTSVSDAESWLKNKRRGKHAKKRGAPCPKKEASALDAILRDATMASPGVLGLYARARAVEVKAFNDMMKGDGITATQASGYAAAQKAVKTAADAAADYLIQCRRLIPETDIMAALQAQDGVSMGLLASMPYTLAPLLHNQPLETITAELIAWRDGTFLAKRLEAVPFAASKEKSFVDDILADADAEEKEEDEK